MLVGTMADRWKHAASHGEGPGLEERAGTRAHFGVVARQEEVRRRPLQNGGGGGSGIGGPRQRGLNLGEVAGNGVPLMLQRADEALYGAQIDPGQGAMSGSGERGELLQHRHTLGASRVGEAQERLGLADRTDAGLCDLLCGPGQVLDRAELASGHREDVDRPEHGRGQEAVRAVEARLGGTERCDRSTGQDCVS